MHKTRLPTLEELAHAIAYVLREYHYDDRVDLERWAQGLAFGQDYEIDDEDRRIAAEALPQLSAEIWLQATARADYLATSQRLPSRYGHKSL